MRAFLIPGRDICNGPSERAARCDAKAFSRSTGLQTPWTRGSTIGLTVGRERADSAPPTVRVIRRRGRCERRSSRLRVADVDVVNVGQSKQALDQVLDVDAVRALQRHHSWACRHALEGQLERPEVVRESVSLEAIAVVGVNEDGTRLGELGDTGVAVVGEQRARLLALPERTQAQPARPEAGCRLRQDRVAPLRVAPRLTDVVATSCGSALTAKRFVAITLT